MKKKLIAIVSLLLGFISFTLSVFSDSLKGEQIDIGPAQIVLLLVSLLVIGCALAALIFRINPIELIYGFLKKCASRIDRFLSKAELESSKFLSKKSIVKLQDVFFLALFAVYAILYTLGRWNGNTPFIFLRGDASAIASFAAALDHPAFFTNDFTLYPLSKVEQYISIQVPIIRLLGNAFNGYGNAFLFILPITIFLKLFGFYQLGKFLLKKPFYGFLLSAVTLPVIYIGIWDYWGLVGDTLPRNLFEILFPWLILWSIKWRNEPKKWILFSLILGGLSYVHSISAPVIFLSLWTTLFISSKLTIREKIRRFLPALFLYVVLIIPFSIGFFKPTTSNPKLGYEEGWNLLLYVFGNHLNLSQVISGLYYGLLRSGLFVPFTIALVVLMIPWKKRGDSQALMIIGWIIGILCFTIGLSFIEAQIEHFLKLLPLQMFLIRGIRYLPPLLVILIFLAFSQIGQLTALLPYPRLIRFSIKPVFGLILFSILIYSIDHNDQGGYVLKEISCLQKGRITCQTSEEKDSIDIVKAAREQTAIGDVIIALPPYKVSFEGAARYEMLRPIGYRATDIARGIDLYDIKKLIEILEPWRQLEKFPVEENLPLYVTLAPSLNIDYLIIQKKDFPGDQIDTLDIVYSNSSYALVKVGQ